MTLIKMQAAVIYSVAAVKMTESILMMDIKYRQIGHAFRTKVTFIQAQ